MTAAQFAGVAALHRGPCVVSTMTNAELGRVDPATADELVEAGLARYQPWSTWLELTDAGRFATVGAAA